MWLGRAWPGAHAPFVGYFWEEGAALFWVDEQSRAAGSCCIHLPCTLGRQTFQGWLSLSPELPRTGQSPGEGQAGIQPVPAAFSHISHCCAASCTVLCFQALLTDLPDPTSPLTFCWAVSVNHAFLKTDEDTALGKKKPKKTNSTKTDPFIFSRRHHQAPSAPRAHKMCPIKHTWRHKRCLQPGLTQGLLN